MAPPVPGPQLRSVCRLRGHEERVWCVAWRPGADRLQLATCGGDRTVRLWGFNSSAGALEDGHDEEEAEQWALVCEIDASERHSRTLRSLSWNPDGTTLAVASFDASASLWCETERETEEQVDDGESSGLNFVCRGVVTGHENEVKWAAFSPTGEYFATCSRDKSAWVYEVDNNTFEYECRGVLQSHTQDVKMIRWHPSQDVLFSCSYDDTIKVWAPEYDDWACKETLQGHTSTVWCLAFDAAGGRFASCSDDKTLRVWLPGAPAGPQPTAPSQTKLASGLTAAARMLPLFRAAAAVPSGSQPAAGGTEERTSTWAAPPPPADAACQWSCAATVENYHPRPVYSCDWLHFPVGGSGANIATACGDNRIRIFRPADEASMQRWECVAEVEAHDGDVNAVAWHSRPWGQDAALLASVGDDAEVVIWQLSG